MALFSLQTILSLIVSLAVAAGGGAALPAVPETATVITLSEVSLSVNDVAVELEPQARLTLAAGTDLAQAAFEVISDGETLLPLAGEINGNEILFSISDGGSAYSISNDTLANSVDVTDGVDAEDMEVFSMMQELIALVPEMAGMEADPELGLQLINRWVEDAGAAFEETTLEIDGVSVPAQSAQLDLDLVSVVSSLDILLENENEVIQKYARLMLRIMNSSRYADYQSFTEMAEDIASASAENPTIPVEITIAMTDEISYAGFVLEETEGTNLVISALQMGEVMEMSMFMTVDEEDGSQYFYNFFADLDGEGNANAGMIINTEDGYSVTSTDDDGNDYLWGNEYTSSGMMDLSIQNTGDGMKDMYFSIDIYETSLNYDESDGSREEDEGGMYLSVELTDSAEEDGSITTDGLITLSSDGFNDEMHGELRFKLNRAELPFESAFAAKDPLPITFGESEDGETSPAMQQLEIDALSLMADLMTLSADPGVVDFFDLVEDGELNDAYDYEDYSSEEDTYEEDVYADYSYDAPATLEEAIEIYGGDVPAYTAPEGYELDYIYADVDYLSLDYINEDGYFSLSVTPSYRDANSAIMVLGEDGSLSDLPGSAVEISLNEDGSVSYATVLYGEHEVTFYFDDVPMDTARAIIAGLAG